MISEVDYVYNTMHPILQAEKRIQIVIRTMYLHFNQSPTRKPIGQGAQQVPIPSRHTFVHFKQLLTKEPTVLVL